MASGSSNVVRLPFGPDGSGPEGPGGSRPEPLAVNALKVVARGVTARQGAPVPLDPALLDMLRAGVENPVAVDLQNLAQQMLAAGVRRDALFDHYVPAVAHDLGEKWCRDERSFVEVTVGVSRLQAMLSACEPPRPEAATPVLPGRLLVVVAHDSFHTLGAVLLASQLRRRGLLVDLCLGARPIDISLAMERGGCAGVLISAAASESLERLHRLVESVHTAPGTSPPVIIGGGLLNAADIDDRLAELVGADLATNDLNEALGLCGLQIDHLEQGR